MTNVNRPVDGADAVSDPPGRIASCAEQRVGRHYVTRVAPAGDEYRLHGAAHPVGLAQREMILDAQDDPTMDLEALHAISTPATCCHPRSSVAAASR